MYSARVGSVSEIVFSAIGMKPPGLASIAPAPTIAIAGEDAIFDIFSIIDCVVFGFTGLRIRRPAKRNRTAASTMSRIETHVFG